MNMKEKKTLQYVVLICAQKHRDKFLRVMKEHGGQVVNIVYGKGSVNGGAWAKAFGLDEELARAVITALVPTPKAVTLMDLLLKEYGFGQANTGIAFATPVEGLTF